MRLRYDEGLRFRRLPRAPIEEKVSGLEDYHVAFEVRLRCDERVGVGDVRDV